MAYWDNMNFMVDTGNKFLDPGDLFGQQASQQSAALKKQQDAERAQMMEQLNKMPTYQGRAVKGVMDKNGTLKPNYQLNWAGDISNPASRIGELDQRMGLAQNVNAGRNYGQAQYGLNQLQQRAFGMETSPWAQKLYESQALDEANQRDQLGMQGNIATNQALNRMASTTGYDPAARERMMRNQQMNKMMGSQNLAGQGAHNRLNIGIQDEQQRMALQQQMPQMFLQQDQYMTGLDQYNNNLALQKANMWSGQANTEDQQNLQNAWNNRNAQMAVNQYNIGNRMGLMNNANQAKLAGWNTQMQTMGAGRTADAMANDANKKQGFLGGLFG